MTVFETEGTVTVPDRPAPVVLGEDPEAYEALDGAPGMELARSISAAGTTSLGGGFVRFPVDGALAGWTLRYDEVFFVLSGALTVDWEGGSVRGEPGEVVLIPKGATVSYRGIEGTKAFFVLHPRDWALRTGMVTGAGSPTPAGSALNAELDGAERPDHRKEEL